MRLSFIRNRVYAHFFLVTSHAFETNNTVSFSEKCIVTTTAYV